MIARRILQSEIVSYLSSSFPQRNGPLMCFNAFKHYEFGWYSSQTTTVTGDWDGELVAFTDAAQAPGSSVILKLNNVYMQFNRAKGKNTGTKEKQNEVVLVRGSQANEPTEVLAGLGSGESYSTDGYTIEVCSINYGSVDNAQISIFTDGGSSGCSTRGIGDSPTDTPTSSPVSYVVSPTCQDDMSRNFIVRGYIRNCQWIADQGGGFYCDGSAKHWCRSTCGTCPP